MCVIYTEAFSSPSSLLQSFLSLYVLSTWCDESFQRGKAFFFMVAEEEKPIVPIRNSSSFSFALQLLQMLQSTKHSLSVHV